jgi:hypothetical protein
MNYYNSETLLEQQAEIEKMKAERDALAAQVEVLNVDNTRLRKVLGVTQNDLYALKSQVEAFKKIREDWQGLAINDAKTLIAFIEAADATPAACLAQVRAEAGRAGFIDGSNQTFHFLTGEIGEAPLLEARANQYAKRQGGTS